MARLTTPYRTCAPFLLPRLFVPTVCLFLLLAAPSARAGYYYVNYTDGTITTPGTSTPYYYQEGYGYGASGNSSGSAPFVNCNGQITATFTWFGSDPFDLPPPSVIVFEQCTTQAQGQLIMGSPTFTMSASDGFGDTGSPSGNTITCS